jgi:hypothetical protein
MIFQFQKKTFLAGADEHLFFLEIDNLLYGMENGEAARRKRGDMQRNNLRISDNV